MLLTYLFAFFNCGHCQDCSYLTAVCVVDMKMREVCGITPPPPPGETRLFFSVAAEDAIRAMLDRDAEEAEDDNLFNIPAGTDFGSPLDNDDDIGDGFDIAYHG